MYYIYIYIVHTRAKNATSLTTVRPDKPCQVANDSLITDMEPNSNVILPQKGVMFRVSCECVQYSVVKSHFVNLSAPKCA